MLEEEHLYYCIIVLVNKAHCVYRLTIQVMEKDFKKINCAFCVEARDVCCHFPGIVGISITSLLDESLTFLFPKTMV